MPCGKCVVVREEMTEDDVISIRNSQQNTVTQNCRNGKETAFSKALNGSKIYLRAHGFMDGSEE